MESVVAISRLGHAFGKGQLSKPVLLDINLTIGAGEIVILTGPSGSGKTTLLSLMGGLRSLQQGSLRILGQELLGATKAQMVELRSRIGYIFQAHNLLDCLTAQENVRMALRLQKHLTYDDRTEKAMAMLEALGLGHRLNYLPDDLSGGQKQRVAIARALVNQPKLVLADEPTAALDSKSGREVVELMKGLAHDQGCTILLVTHDNRILDIAHRIVHMEDGRLIKTETPSTTPQAVFETAGA
jgi:putative ABC transport system ATP-binding protein